MIQLYLKNIDSYFEEAIRVLKETFGTIASLSFFNDEIITILWQLLTNLPGKELQKMGVFFTYNPEMSTSYHGKTRLPHYEITFRWSRSDGEQRRPVFPRTAVSGTFKSIPGIWNGLQC
jgi:hypothetical protein